MNRPSYICSDDIERVLTFEVLMPVIEDCLKAFSKGSKHPEGAIQPLRSKINVDRENGQVLVMPGYLPGSGALTTKIVSLFPDNAKVGKVTHSAVVILMDPRDGFIKSFLEGNCITGLRTAAASGIASKLLSPEIVTKICILGSGVQGASHARVHHFLFKPCRISIWSRSFANSEKLVTTLTSEGLDAIAASTVEVAAKDADIINTCTLAVEPILWQQYVKPGAHINAVGAPCPAWRELDPSIMKSSIIYVDSKEAALAEAGDVIQSGAEIFGEIGEVLNGELTSKRTDTTVFKILGMAVMDSAAALLAYKLLNKDNMGKE